MGNEIFSKIKRDIMKQILEITENMNERLSKNMNETEITNVDIETETDISDDQPDWDVVRDDWEQIQGKGALVDQFKDSALMLMEYRILQDYSSYLDKNHGLIQTKKRIGAALSHPYNMSWIDVSAALEKEEKEFRRARAASDENEWPATPWRSDVILAVMILRNNLTIRQLTWEIHEHAKRSKRGENGVNSLIREGDWYNLATQILRDLDALDFVFPPSRRNDKNSIKLAIERLSDQYFHGVRRLESGGLFCEPKWDFWDPNGIVQPFDKWYTRRTNGEHHPATTE